MDAYIGEIRIFAGTYAPENWAYCNGQLLNIRQYTPLFSIIGTTYGGNGTTTFALPNLQGNATLGAGNGPNLTPRQLGETSQADGYTLNSQTMPAHSHALNGTAVTVSSADPTNAYTGSFPNLREDSKHKYVAGGTPNGKLDPASISPAGNANPAPVSVVQPFLAVGFAICLSGNFPSRP